IMAEKAWQQYAVECTAKDPHSFLITVFLTLAFIPLFLTSTVLESVTEGQEGVKENKKKNIRICCKSKTTEKGFKE
uniref:Uncharacterized protein n=1 Tax=Mus spicilegus TaxID=10103 RepID=A0A8C6HNB0_MUSSI